ncbi:MAG: hypothetical protein RR405_00600, partial [Clostridia bacterium]
MFWDNEKLMRTRNIKHQNGNQNKLLNRVTKVALLAMLFVMSFSVMISGMIDGTFLSAGDIFSKIDSAVTGNPQDDNSSNIAEAADPGPGNVGSQTIDLSNIFDYSSQSQIGINPDVSKRGRAWTTNYDHTSIGGYWNSTSWIIGDGTSHSGADYFMVWFDFDLGNNWDKLNDSITISLSGSLSISAKTNCGIVALGTTETLQGKLVGGDDYVSKVRDNNTLKTTGEVASNNTVNVNLSHKADGRYARIYFAIYDYGGAVYNNTFNNISVQISRTLKTYKTVYDPNGGRGLVADTTHKFMENSNVSNQSFQKENYFQEKWNTKADGTGVAMPFGSGTGNTYGSGTFGEYVKNELSAGRLPKLYSVWADLQFIFNKVLYKAVDSVGKTFSVLKTKAELGEYLTVANLPAGFSGRITYFNDFNEVGTGYSARPTALGDYSAKLEVLNASDAVTGYTVINFIVVEGDFGRLVPGSVIPDGSGEVVSGVWGTKTNPYVISTPLHMRNLSGIGSNTQTALDSIVGVNEVTASQATATSTAYANSFFLILNDINLSGIDIVPIANLVSAPFLGNIDGNNKTISNINVSSPRHAGLFGFFGGTVNWDLATDKPTGKTFTITGTVKTTGVGIAVNDRGYAGGIFSEFVGSHISRISGCISEVAVSAEGGGYYVGGIVGIVHGGKIVNCENRGAVSATGDVGGIVGRLNNATVSGCKNTGAVTGTGSNIGGIVGNIFSPTGSVTNYKKNIDTIINTQNSATIIGINNVGGIVGISVDNNFVGTYINTAFIQGDNYVGGIIGYYKATTAHTWKSFIATNSCVNPNLLDNDGVRAKVAYAGGIFGYIEIVAGGSLLIEDVSTLTNTAAVDSENGGSSVIGGIVGFNGGATITAKMLVSCGEGVYSRGTTTLNLNGTQYTGSFAGGIVGVNLGTISNATFESGNVISVGSGDFLGGIAGFNCGIISNCSTKAGKYQNGTSMSTNIGTVAGSFAFYGNYVGGIVGYSTGTISNCFNGASVKGVNNVGGIAGYTSNTISNCANEATVTGTGSNVGGIVGSGTSSISYCFNLSAVSGGSVVGGLVGTGSTATDSWAFYTADKTAGHNDIGKYVVSKIGKGFIPTVDGANKTWADIVSTNINGWRLDLATAFDIAFGSYLSIANSSNVYIQPNTLTTSKNGNIVSLTELYYLANNSASNVIVQTKAINFVGNNFTYTANDIVGALVTNNSGCPSVYAYAYIYTFSNSSNSQTTANPTTVKNAGNYKVAVTITVDGKFVGNGADGNGTSKITVASKEINVAATATIGWVDGYKYNAQHQGISGATITLLGSDSLSTYIELWKTGNTVICNNPNIPTGSYTFGGAINYGTYSITFALKGTANGLNGDFVDNYKFVSGSTPATSGNNKVSNDFKTVTFEWKINSCEVTLNSQATAGNTYIYTHQHQGVNTITPQILLGNGRFGSLHFQTGENLATYFDVAYYRYCSGVEETAAYGWIIDASGYGYRPIVANADGVYTFKGNVEVGGLPRPINAVNVYGGDNGVGNNGYKIVFKIKDSLGDKANNYKFSTAGAGTQEAVALTRTATQYTYVWHITPFGLTVTPTATGRWQNAGWNGYIYHENAPHQGLNNVSINFFNGDIASNYIDVSYKFQNPTTSAWTDKTATPSGNTAYTFFADKASNFGAYKIVFKIKDSLGDKANNYKFTTGANDHAISDGIDTYQTGKTVDERSLSYTWNITQYDFTKYSAINYTGLASGYKPDGTYINNNFNWYTQGVNGAYGVDNALNNGGTLFMVYNYDLSQDDFITKLLGYDNKGNKLSEGVLKFVLGANLGAPSAHVDFLTALYADGGSITLTLDNYPTAGNNGVAYATFKITVNSGAGNKNFVGSTLNLTAFILDGDFGKGATENWGSETNPYLISHWAHLFRLSQISNGATPWDSVSGTNGTTTAQAQASNINYTGAYFKVTKDFTVKNALKTTGNWSAQTAVTNFKPIGKIAEPGVSEAIIFNGIFDATNYKINLTIANYGGWAGLFGFVGGTISNVTVEGSVQSNGGYSAGIVAELSGGTIRNCISSVTVSGGTEFVGGIAGIVHGGSIIDCENRGVVSGTNDIGGIVGRLNNATVSGCSNTGAVKGTGSNIGGIVGRSIGAITNGANSGSVISSGNYVGGIVGYAENCDFSGSFTNTGYIEGNDYVGGIIGCYLTATARTWDSFIANNSCLQNDTDFASHGGDDIRVKGMYGGGIFGCIDGELTISGTGSSMVNSASIDSEDGLNVVGGQSAIIGGIVGLNKGGILTAEMTVNIDTSRGNANADVGLFSRNNKATYSADGVTYTGAFVGGIAGINTGIISNATILSAQIISIWLVGGAFVGGDYVGGIVGLNLNGVVSNCALTANAVVGSVKNAATSAVTKFPAWQYSGGIVGRSVGGKISGTKTGTKTGTMTSNASVTGINYVGGIVGYADGTVITLDAPTVTGVITGKSYVGALFGSAVGSAGGYQTEDGKTNKTWKDVPQ